ncbi:MAG TPA: hypothetical protein PLZ43_08275 [bacterium]|nr:hypothetical protein [bacterium]
MVVWKGANVIAVCEHKIDSDINGGQLTNYRGEYEKCKNFFLIKPEYSQLRKLNKKEKDFWNELTWEQLFEVIKESFFPKYWKYDTDEDYFEHDKKPKRTSENKLIYYFLAYLVSEGLFRLDMNYYAQEYKSFSNLLKKSKQSVSRFFEYVKLLKTEKGRQQGGSKIRDFIDNWRIYIKYKEDYMGFYGYYIGENDNEFCMLDWNKKNKPMKFDRIKNKYSSEFSLNFKSIKDFNKQFEKTADYLQDMNSLLLEIVKFVGSELSINSEEFKLNAEKETEDMVYEFEYKKTRFQISFSENSFRLYFSGTSKQPKGSRAYEHHEDWRYFEINVENMKFTGKNFSGIKKSFVRHMNTF